MPTAAPNAPQIDPRPAGWLPWALFLAASWTWCIGMFLPVLLIRDFGWPGYAVFALPNVIGAAAMGWVLHRPGASQAMIARHRPAMLWFSAVTILFQVYFAGLIGGLASTIAHRPALALAIFVVAAAGSALTRGPAMAVMSWLASALLALWFLRAAETPIQAAAALGTHPDLPLDQTIPLSLVCTFGFALCPYLDLTFHRARQALSPTDGRWAFTIGFGVFFLAMIAFTACYAPVFADPEKNGTLTAIVIAHIMLQTGLTGGLHTRELLRQGQAGRLLAVGALGLAVVWLGICWRTAGFDEPLLSRPMSWKESGYRIIMGAYGLLFPSYLVVCRGRPSAHPHSRKHLAAWVTAIVCASPMFWQGFVERRTWWLVPGLTVVGAAAAYARRFRAVAGHESPN